MMTTTSHFNQPTSETIDAFKNWLKGWDATIHTHDDRESQEMISEKLLFIFTTIEKLLHDSDQKVMLKARGSLEPGSDAANEKEVMAMLLNQKRTWYKDLKRASCLATSIKNTISDIYELKNRRNDEVFKLRSENAQLRLELEKYRNV